MSADVTPFVYGETEVRTVTVNGEPWFVLADLCRVLDMARGASQVAGRLDEGVRQTYPLRTPGGRQLTTIVSEAGMYEVVIRSDKPEAATFRRWITGTVLPQIRRTGSFTTAPALSDAEKAAEGMAAAMRILEQKDARIQQLETQAEADAPKVTYVDTYVTDADLLSFSTVASTCRVTEKALRTLLIDRGWIYVQTDSRWSNSEGRKVERRRYSEKADKKRYFRRVEVHDAPRFRGSEVMHTLKITPQGAQAIARLVSRDATDRLELTVTTEAGAR